MNKTRRLKQYDLEERTFVFARNTRAFVKKLSKTIGNWEDNKQLVRSSGSMGANYIEANESLGKKDFVYRIKICRKESKETIYWLKLVDAGGKNELEEERQKLINEAIELMKIFGAILEKSK
ncbi:four helix bundle protein [Patescibacteria group bacterium]|nr:four helix bundle protein [Patescibacteria group bacterium]